MSAKHKFVERNYEENLRRVHGKTLWKDLPRLGKASWMKTYSYSKISKPLINISSYLTKQDRKQVTKEALTNFRDLLRAQSIASSIFSDGAVRTELVEITQRIISRGKRFSLLQDEIYVQIAKQQLDNPNIPGVIFSFQLLYLCLFCFPPKTESVQNCLETHVARFSSLFVNTFTPFDRVPHIAARCFEVLQKPFPPSSCQSPSDQQIHTLLTLQSIPVTLQFTNQTSARHLSSETFAFLVNQAKISRLQDFLIFPKLDSFCSVSSVLGMVRTFIPGPASLELWTLGSDSANLQRTEDFLALVDSMLENLSKEKRSGDDKGVRFLLKVSSSSGLVSPSTIPVVFFHNPVSEEYERASASSLKQNVLVKRHSAPEQVIKGSIPTLDLELETPINQPAKRVHQRKTSLVRRGVEDLLEFGDGQSSENLSRFHLLLIQGLAELNKHKMAKALRRLEQETVVVEEINPRLFQVAHLLLEVCSEKQFQLVKIRQGIYERNVIKLAEALDSVGGQQLVLERFNDTNEGKRVIQECQQELAEMLDATCLDLSDDLDLYRDRFPLASFPFLRSPTSFSRWGPFVRHDLKEKMLVFSRSVIPKSLISFKAAGIGGFGGKRLSKQAVESFRDVLVYQRIVENEFPFEAMCRIVFRGYQQPELRDEIYAQLIKQTNQNVERESFILAFKLMFVCLKSFLPRSQGMRNTLKDHLSKYAALELDSFSSFDTAEDLSARCFSLLEHPKTLLPPPSGTEAFIFYNICSRIVRIRIAFDTRSSSQREATVFKLRVTIPPYEMMKSEFFATEFRQGTVGELCGIIGGRLGATFLPRLKVVSGNAGSGKFIHHSESFIDLLSDEDILDSHSHTLILVPHQTPLKDTDTMIAHLLQTCDEVIAETSPIDNSNVNKLQMKQLTSLQINAKDDEDGVLPPPSPMGVVPDSPLLSPRPLPPPSPRVVLFPTSPTVPPPPSPTALPPPSPRPSLSNQADRIARGRKVLEILRKSSMEKQERRTASELEAHQMRERSEMYLSAASAGGSVSSSSSVARKSLPRYKSARPPSIGL